MVTISGLLVALIRIMCTALPSASAKLVLDGKTVSWQSPSYVNAKLACLLANLVPVTVGALWSIP